MDITHNKVTPSFTTRAAQFTVPHHSVSAERDDRAAALQAKASKSDPAMISFLKAPIARVVSEHSNLASLIAKPEQFKNELAAQGARRELVAHQVSIKQGMLKTLMLAPKEASASPFSAPNAYSAGSSAPGEADISAYSTGSASETAAMSAGVDAAASGEARKGSSSSSEICDSVFETIKELGPNYIDVFQNAVEEYSKFFGELIDAFGQFAGFYKPGSKDGCTAVDTLKMIDLINDVIAKYAPVALFTGGKEECLAWCKELGLDPDKSLRGGPDVFTVEMDTSPLDEINSILGKFKEPSNLNSAQFSALQSGMDMQKDAVQNALQTVTQKYSNANSTFDNLVKVLSSTITSLLDSDKSFLTI